MIGIMIISTLYAAGHTWHQSHFHPLREPLWEIAMPNVVITDFAYTFHILGTAPRPAIFFKMRPIMALQILDSIVDGYPVGTVMVMVIQHEDDRFCIWVIAILHYLRTDLL